MPFDPSTVPERLVEAAQNHNLVPLIGSGVSRQADRRFPSWSGLLQDMKTHALKSGWLKLNEAQQVDELLTRDEHLMVAEEFRYRFPTDAFEAFLHDKFPTDVKPAEIHKALLRLEPPLILTTNYDRLLENAYAQEYSQAPTTYTYNDSVMVQRYLQGGKFGRGPLFFKIHGSIDDPGGIILSERDYRQLIYQQPGYKMVLSAILLTRVVLMIGFSFSDRELTLHLESIRESLKHRAEPDYIFMPESEAPDIKKGRWREDFGLQTITYKASRGHPEMLAFVNYLASTIPSKSAASGRYLRQHSPSPSRTFKQRRR